MVQKREYPSAHPKPNGAAWLSICVALPQAGSQCCRLSCSFHSSSYPVASKSCENKLHGSERDWSSQPRPLPAGWGVTGTYCPARCTSASLPPMCNRHSQCHQFEGIMGSRSSWLGPHNNDRVWHSSPYCPAVKTALVVGYVLWFPGFQSSSAILTSTF